MSGFVLMLFDVAPSVDHGLIGYELVKRGVSFAVFIFVWTKNDRCHEKMKRSCGNSRDSWALSSKVS